MLKCNSLSFRYLLSLLLLTVSSSVLAHARFKPEMLPLPRNADASLKTAPCGVEKMPRGDIVTSYYVNSEIKIAWEETVDHNGYYLINFSPADDTGFTELKRIDDLPQIHQYETTIKLPDKPCDACTLQLVQVMVVENYPDTFYYSCANIKLMAADTTLPPIQVPNLTILQEKADFLLKDFSRFDLNKDLQLELSEVTAVFATISLTDFQTIDKNNDEFWIAAEMAPVLPADPAPTPPAPN